jgi:hypothetical protein
VRDGFGLIDQFERAAAFDATKSSNWLFVAAEVKYDQASDNPGIMLFPYFVRSM